MLITICLTRCAKASKRVDGHPVEPEPIGPDICTDDPRRGAPAQPTGDALMNRTCPFAETIQPVTEANPRQIRAALLRFDERRFSTLSPAIPSPSNKRSAGRAAA